jgi:hypothetical protein
MLRNTAAAPSMQVPPWLDRLGGLATRFRGLCVRLGDLETRLQEDDLAEIPIERPVYIGGLARCGSTILLELLARHPEFATHRYRDFPFVLTPTLWNWFVDRAGKPLPPASERAHRDGIMVTRESPEAFEEVLWMAFFPQLHDPAQSAVLDGRISHSAFERFYRDHIRKLLRLRGGVRYLAKGNYNSTRLGYLRKLFPDARFIVPVRDPVWHVASLHKQHALFMHEEAANPRVLRHMQRAGHFEFGLDRRPVNAGDTAETARILDLWKSGRELEGWAAYWSAIYRYVADTLEADRALRAATLVVRYEDLCRRPREVMAEILEHCDLPPNGLLDAAAAILHEPRYYRPSFTRAEVDILRREAGATAQRFGYSG